MKLAEALLERKALQTRIAELQSRYSAAAVIEVHTTSDESAAELLVSLGAAFERFEKLVVAINVTNNETCLPIGTVGTESMTIMQAIARRDTLKSQIAHYTAIRDSLRQRNQMRRYQENAPKMILAEGVDIGYFIKLVDDRSKDLRILDTAIQAANWSNDLVELE